MFQRNLSLLLAGIGLAACPLRAGAAVKFEPVLARLPKYAPAPAGFPTGASYLTPDGAIRIVGYNDMQGIFEAVDALFVQAHPGFKFALALKGTKAAAAALTKGESAFAPMGAELYEADVSVYQRSLGSYPLEFRVAHDAVDPHALSSPIAICVPRASPLRSLTVDQVRRIFTIGTAQPAFTVWGQLGLTGKWTDQPLHVYGLGLNTSLGYFMQKHHFGGRPYRSDFTAIYRSQDVAQRIGQDPLAVGFTILNNVTSAIRVIGIAARPDTKPSFGCEEELIAGLYPYDRQLLIYVRQPIEPWISDYLSLLLSREGQRAVVEHSPGYLPLNDQEIAQERAKLAS
jgi:phosphate transport system substrate-binding protein